jgi:hypothetical protein
MGPLHMRQAIATILKISLAAVLMGTVAWITEQMVAHIAVFSLNYFIGQFLTLLIAGSLAVITYVSAILLFKVEEVHLLKEIILTKLKKK